MELAKQILNGAKDRMNGYISTVCPHATRTFFESDEFPWARAVELRWAGIQAEAAALLHLDQPLPDFNSISKQQQKIGGWRALFLHVYGNPIESSCRACPATADALRLIPGMLTAFFSVLEPGQHIKPHVGPYKGVLRYHLGLIVPAPAPEIAIRVGDDIRGWAEGRSLIFDDTHVHEAWNNSDSTRVVLFVDFVRPLPMPAKALNSALVEISKRAHPSVREVKRNTEAYTRSALAGGLDYAGVRQGEKLARLLDTEF